MNNFSNVQSGGYDRKEVNDFVDYVIKKTEENILTIRRQQEEIEYLKAENEKLSKLENSYMYIQNEIENRANEIKANAKYEAELIIREAKDNASNIVNNALLKSEKILSDKERLNNTLKIYKRKVRAALLEQLEIIDDIEVGNIILLENGLMRLDVISKEKDGVTCKVIHGGILGNKKSMAVPGVKLNMPFISDQDREDIIFACEHEGDYV